MIDCSSMQQLLPIAPRTKKSPSAMILHFCPRVLHSLCACTFPGASQGGISCVGAASDGDEAQSAARSASVVRDIHSFTGMMSLGAL